MSHAVQQNRNFRVPASSGSEKKAAQTKSARSQSRFFESAHVRPKNLNSFLSTRGGAGGMALPNPTPTCRPENGTGHDPDDPECV